MSDLPPRMRPWYREPETFIAVTALIVSISTVVVALYEASLQRKHDRAEVWPNLEIATFTKPTGAAVYLDNTGIGPGIVKEVVVSVDGHPMTSWEEVMTTLLGHAPPRFSRSSILHHGMRPGDRITLVDLPTEAMPPNFLDSVRRVTMTICYSSVFDEDWTVTGHLGGELTWASMKSCPPQPSGVRF